MLNSKSFGNSSAVAQWGYRIDEFGFTDAIGCMNQLIIWADIMRPFIVSVNIFAHPIIDPSEA